MKNFGLKMKNYFVKIVNIFNMGKKKKISDKELKLKEQIIISKKNIREKLDKFERFNFWRNFYSY